MNWYESQWRFAELRERWNQRNQLCYQGFGIRLHRDESETNYNFYVGFRIGRIMIFEKCVVCLEAYPHAILNR